MATRRRHYGACILLVQLLIACAPAGPSQDAMAANAAQASAEASAQASAQVSAQAPADAGAADASTPAKLIVAFGDSLYAGYQLGADEGFAPELERRLRADGVAARVVNAGVSGDTSAAGLQRLAFTLDGLPRAPDLVIVGLGGNDMLRGLAPAATRSNLDAILAELKRRQIPAMLTGMLASPNMGADYGAAFNGIYPALAQKYGISLYPFFLDGVIGQRDLMLADGIHPNADGVDIIVDGVSPAVIAAVQH